MKENVTVTQVDVSLVAIWSNDVTAFDYFTSLSVMNVFNFYFMIGLPCLNVHLYKRSNKS